MTTSRTQNEQALVLLILSLSRLYRRALNRAMAVHGMSDAQAMPVLLISRLGDGVRQGVLAEELGVEGPSLVRQLDQLQTAGLVERRIDPADGRGRTLHLTPTGHAFAEVVEKVLGERRHTLLAGLDDFDLANAVSGLQRFEQAVTTALDHPGLGDRA